ncbi:unnamed protein product [Urochloa humidicola]
MSLDVELILQAISRRFEAFEAKWETRFAAEVTASPVVLSDQADAELEVPLAACTTSTAMGAAKIIASAESLAVSRAQPGGAALLVSQSTTTPTTTIRTAPSSPDMVPTSSAEVIAPTESATTFPIIASTNPEFALQTKSHIHRGGTLHSLEFGIPAGTCSAMTVVNKLVSPMTSTSSSSTPTKALGEPTAAPSTWLHARPAVPTCPRAPAAQGTEDEIPTNTPTKCSTECFNHDIDVLKSMDTVTSVWNAPLTFFSFTDDIPLDINEVCSMVHLQERYITKISPSLSASIVLKCVAIGAHEYEAALDSMPIQNTILFGTVCAYVFGKEKWPPPIYLDTQRTEVQVRPIPWPSFGYCNVYGATFLHSKKDMDFVLWINWKIPWPFFWKLSSVYLLCVGFISCCVASSISYWKSAVRFIQLCRHGILLDLGCPQLQGKGIRVGLFIWSRWNFQCSVAFFVHFIIGGNLLPLIVGKRMFMWPQCYPNEVRWFIFSDKSKMSWENQNLDPMFFTKLSVMCSQQFVNEHILEISDQKDVLQYLTSLVKLRQKLYDGLVASTAEEQQVILWHFSGEQCFLADFEFVDCLREWHIGQTAMFSDAVQQRHRWFNSDAVHISDMINSYPLGLPFLLAWSANDQPGVVEREEGASGIIPNAIILASLVERLKGGNKLLLSNYLILLHPMCHMPCAILLLDSVSFQYTKVQVTEMLYPLLIAEILFSSKRLISDASFVEMKTKFVTSTNHLHTPWDPGGIVLINRLGGKPNLKKGGMSGMSVRGDHQMGPSCQLELGKSARVICVSSWAGLGCRACRHKKGIAHVISLHTVERGKERTSIIMYEHCSSS